MPDARNSQALPVLYLYNVEPDWSAQDAQVALASNLRMAAALEQAGHPVVSIALTDDDLPAVLSRHSPLDHIVFNQCESIPGVPHSEHEAVRIIEAFGFSYTGSGPDVLLLTGDKEATKRILDARNIPTPLWKVYTEPVAGDWTVFPAIVKTTREHCSLSLTPESVVLNRQGLEKRIAFILENYRQPALVEDFIDGREFHVPVWGDGTITVLPVVEMDFSACKDVHDRLCTYDAKFAPESRDYNIIQSLIPAPLRTDELRTLERVCVDAYSALGCRDYARLDIRERNGAFYVLDVNPNADLDSEASIACSAEYSGITYPELMHNLVRLAANRHPVHGRSA
jgi:D-alanine-D-alanine ligase